MKVASNYQEYGCHPHALSGGKNGVMPLYNQNVNGRKFQVNVS